MCGAVINIRTKGDKIAVWTREAENQEGVLHIGGGGIPSTESLLGEKVNVCAGRGLACEGDLWNFLCPLPLLPYPLV